MKNCYLFVFDGFSDWEASYATVGIAKSESFHVRTIALEKKPLQSMGGMMVIPEFDFIPEVDLDDIHPSNTAMLILPGGTAWEKGANEKIIPLIMHCVERGIPVAGICGATVMLANLGLLNDIPHTSNDLEYLRYFSKGYVGDESYRYYPAIATDHVVTASGAGAIEFAREIFDILDIGSEEGVRSWFQDIDKVTL